MPSVDEISKQAIRWIKPKDGEAPLRYASPGVLNYLMTYLVTYWIGELSHSRLVEAIGVLECVKLELYNRLVSPYEIKEKYMDGDS